MVASTLSRSSTSSERGFTPPSSSIRGMNPSGRPTIPSSGGSVSSRSRTRKLALRDPFQRTGSNRSQRGFPGPASPAMGLDVPYVHSTSGGGATATPLARTSSPQIPLNFTSIDSASDNETASYEGLDDFEEFAQQEAKLAVFVKAIFIVVMLLSGILVAITTFRYTSNQEIKAFETKFFEFGNQMVNAVRLNAQNSMYSYQTWSLQVSNIALATNQTWPHVAIPHFEAQSLQSMKFYGARVIGLSPIVRDMQAWGEYSSLDRQVLEEWTQQSLNEYENASLTTGEIQPPPFIYHATPPPIQPADKPLVDNIYLPLWQVSPILENYFIINLDALNFTFVPKVFQRMVETQAPVLSEGFVVPGTESQIPESFMAAPIYNTVFGQHASSSQKKEAPFLVGVLFAFFPWKIHFANLLQTDTPEITVVVRNECVEPFTFSLRGPNVTFLGMGDLHDRAYSDLEVAWEFDEFGNVPNCSNTIHVFPTEAFESTYTTNTPVAYTLTAVGIFFLTMVIFAGYDMFSQRWRYKIEVAARRNSAIVQSLFPHTVRDRLMMDPNGETSPNNHHLNGHGNSILNDNLSGENNNNASNNQNGGTAQFRKRSYNDGMLTRLPDLIPDLRVLSNKIPDLRHLNPMRLLEEITNISLKEQNSNNKSGGNIDQSNRSSGIVNPLFGRDDRPIADLFPSATVLFGDISGFTAWSSQRDPAQVFTLLETIYNAFDKIAKRRKVFKVETIGDCYMAATGLPEARADHAVLMAGFARECLATMNEVVRDLEAKLGPDTGDLAMRFGIHSGPVTAGVLRGEKSRFQLFGDTVNTASRMESTGIRHKIQISQETADLLVAAKRESWIEPREEMIEAKGKGKLQTYWLAVGAVGPSSHVTQMPSHRRISFKPPRRSSIQMNEWDGSFRIDPTIEDVVRSVNQKIERMIDWNVQVLLKHLTDILTTRNKMERERLAALTLTQTGSERIPAEASSASEEEVSSQAASEPFGLQSLDRVVVPPILIRQLSEFVTAIAFLYHDNPFHNFEHASHVTQAVNKLLASLVDPKPRGAPRSPSSSSSDPTSDEDTKATAQSALLKHTFATAEDPTLKFAVAFAALVHDVEHPGVPNTQLVKEKPDLSTQYKGRSVAEKNSIDVAWNLLLEPSFTELRNCLCPTTDDLRQFRRLVVKTVMATDIADKEMSTLRRQRWAGQFDSEIITATEADMNIRAEMFMECLIQASDVSHTMQHWQIYIKWNERLFHECYHAFKTGRAANDPSNGWYAGELSFFDFYIIPLIARLKLLEVFGATTDEFMTYAQANRKEWETKGRDLVKEYIASYKDRIFESPDAVVAT